MKAIDHAFQSRIDFILPYDDLTQEARHEVWKDFIAHMGQERFEVMRAKAKAYMK